MMVKSGEDAGWYPCFIWSVHLLCGGSSVPSMKSPLPPPCRISTPPGTTYIPFGINEFGSLRRGRSRDLKNSLSRIRNFNPS